MRGSLKEILFQSVQSRLSNGLQDFTTIIERNGEVR